MPIITWTAQLDDNNYVIKLDHGSFSGNRLIRVNQKQVLRANKFFDVGHSKYAFNVDTQKAMITIRAGMWGITYDLLVNGKSIGVQEYNYFRNVPRWAWLFFIPLIPMLCIIPAVARNGIGSALIYFVAVTLGFSIELVVSITELRTIVKVLMCVAITLLTYLITFAVHCSLYCTGSR